MKIEQFLIGLVFFSVIMVAGSMIFYDTAVIQYEMDPDMADFESAENASNTSSTYNILQEMRDDIGLRSEQELLGNATSGVGTGDEDTSESLYKGAFKVLMFIPNTFRLMDAIAKDIIRKVEISPIFLTFFTAVLLISVVFAVIYLIWRMRT